MRFEGERKRILIVNGYLDETRRLRGRPHFVPQSVGPAYLAGAFNPELAEIRLYNELASGPLMDEDLLGWPDMLVLTSMTSGYDRMRHLAAYVRTKAPKCVVVAGGPAVRALPELSRRFFDHCCSGDIEELQSVVREVFGADYVAESMDPRFDLVDWTWRLGYVESSRNCNFKCSFCSLTGERLSYKTYDLDYLRRQLDRVGRKTVIVFVDNNFYGNDRAYFLAKLDLLKQYWKKGAFRAWAALVTNDFFLKPENLQLVREAGCGSLFTGVESFDVEVLRRYNKLQNLRLPQTEMIKSCLDAGIILNYGVIFDASARSLADIREEIRFITGTPEITLPVFMNLTIPLLRTPYFYESLEERQFLPRMKLRDMDGNTVIMKTVDPEEEVVEFLKDLPTLRGYKARVMRHTAKFFRLYRGKLDPLFLAVAMGNAGFLCLPALVHDHRAFLKRDRLRQPPRTYITTTEPAGPLYEPFFPVAERYRGHFDPLMITDERGELCENVAADLLAARPAPKQRAGLSARA
jgi:radical SAM superfamily enzyme YgiQ (UPF0313 family)